MINIIAVKSHTTKANNNKFYNWSHFELVNPSFELISEFIFLISTISYSNFSLALFSSLIYFSKLEMYVLEVLILPSADMIVLLETTDLEPTEIL